MAGSIQLLASQHGREHFDCGNAALNDFFRRLAGQQQRRGFGKTYVMLADEEVVGFVTVSAGQVAAKVLPPDMKLPHYPVPMLRIARLAVDLRHQGRGFGQDLLAFALQLALEFSQRVGLFAVVVDAKDEKVASYYRSLGFESTLDNPLCLFQTLSRLAAVR